MTSTSGWGSSSSAAALALLAVLLPAPGEGGVHYSRDEALKLAFPEATVEKRTVFLTDQQVAAVKARVGLEVESKLFTYYTGRRDGAVVGYAVIDTHTVRTLPETFLALLRPDGTIERVVLLAFYEPPEYEPDARWLAQFEGRRLGGSAWRLGHDLHGITGATLTAHAVREGLLKILVLHELVMRQPGPP